jgi:hypothetical protein
MTKQKRTFKIDYSIDWSYATIEQIRKDLDELEKLGATKISTDIVDRWGCDAIEITASADRLETDDEYAKRLKQEQYQADKVRIHELQTLAKLQAKYKTV